MNIFEIFNTKKTVWIAERVIVKDGVPIPDEQIGVARSRAMACALLHGEGFLAGDWLTLTSDLGVKRQRYLFYNSAGEYARVREVPLH